MEKDFCTSISLTLLFLFAVTQTGRGRKAFVSGLEHLSGVYDTDRGQAVAVDSGGNVYVTWLQLRQMGVPDQHLHLVTVKVFLAKYDPDGNRLWHHLHGLCQRGLGHGPGSGRRRQRSTSPAPRSEPGAVPIISLRRRLRRRGYCQIRSRWQPALEYLPGGQQRRLCLRGRP
jgi:hypothetical protein